MSTEVMIIGGIGLAIALLIGLYVIYEQNNRKKHLKDTFGSEYDRAVTESGGVRQAQKELEAREKRVSRLQIKELPADERRRFADMWRMTQERFVDNPGEAVDEADTLVTRVMDARGYPTADFEQRTADISVEHSRVVDNYRAAHEIAERQRGGDEAVSTEEMRRAMIYYRELFDDLLGAAVTQPSR